jgi:hypothetical protein
MKNPSEKSAALSEKKAALAIGIGTVAFLVGIFGYHFSSG